MLQTNAVNNILIGKMDLWFSKMWKIGFTTKVKSIMKMDWLLLLLLLLFESWKQSPRNNGCFSVWNKDWTAIEGICCKISKHNNVSPFLAARKNCVKNVSILHHVCDKLLWQGLLPAESWPHVITAFKGYSEWENTLLLQRYILM